MYEHVGRAQLRRYVARLRALLRPGGLLLNDGITRLTPKPRRGATFISRYVFPDGELHPVGELVAALECERFEVRGLDALREHYATTLRRWVRNLDRNEDEALRLAGAEHVRVWRLYMAGSAQAFERGDLGDFMTLAAA
jgi:cyclopropane-fatty-acyl-phospholipid synthase